MRTYIIAVAIAAGCSTSSFAAGGAGSAGGGGSPSYAMDSRLLHADSRNPQFTIEQLQYVWDDWYKLSYDKLQYNHMGNPITHDKWISVELKRQKIREDFARKLRNHDIVLTPDQVLQIASG